MAPENTIAAIEAAAGAGADMVEIDVHLSRDGELVVAHDFDATLTVADIQARDPRVPTLADCVTRAQSLKLLLNIEIKNLPHRYSGIEDAVIGTIARLDAIGQVLLSSFDHQSLATVRRLNDDVATAVLTQDRLFHPVDYLDRLEADALHPGGYVPDEQLTAAIRETERGINVWTENEPDAMRHLIARGVTGIITDYPLRLAELLDDVTHDAW
jgi:glycerophosphoryl diester phosphodiesterase